MKAKGIARLGVITTLLSIPVSIHAAMVSDLFISEVMVNPAAVSDARGEWFELFNPTEEVINLNNITIRDAGSNLHRIESDLLVLPQQYFVLAKNGDPEQNGGFVADYIYQDFTLVNSGDEIILSDETIDLLRLDYSAGFDEAGRSRTLTGLSMDEASYQLTSLELQYGLGDIGTPGTGSVMTLSAVPLPAAGWLFMSAVLALFTPLWARRTGNG